MAPSMVLDMEDPQTRYAEELRRLCARHMDQERQYAEAIRLRRAQEEALLREQAEQVAERNEIPIGASLVSTRTPTPTNLKKCNNRNCRITT